MVGKNPLSVYLQLEFPTALVIGAVIVKCGVSRSDKDF